jgi:hypothetical protein
VEEVPSCAVVHGAVALVDVVAAYGFAVSAGMGRSWSVDRIDWQAVAFLRWRKSYVAAVKDQVKVIAPLVRPGTAGRVWSKERKVIGVGSVDFS